AETPPLHRRPRRRRPRRARPRASAEIRHAPHARPERGDAACRQAPLGAAGAAAPRRPARRRERGRPPRPLRRLPQAAGGDLRRPDAPLRRVRLRRRAPGVQRQADRDVEPRPLRLRRRLARHQRRHRGDHRAGGGGRLRLLRLGHGGPRRQRHREPRRDARQEPRLGRPELHLRLPDPALRAAPPGHQPGERPVLLAHRLRRRPRASGRRRAPAPVRRFRDLGLGPGRRGAGLHPRQPARDGGQEDVGHEGPPRHLALHPHPERPDGGAHRSAGRVQGGHEALPPRLAEGAPRDLRAGGARRRHRLPRSAARGFPAHRGHAPRRGAGAQAPL
ncbi:MAG: ABC transporter, substrate-binding protein (cluster 12, methionine/phosphonates), partial [uncultured Acetobacteraceae bacterium]